MNDADKQYRAMHPGQAQQFHADDSQTPESADMADKIKALNESFLRCPIEGCYENDRVRFVNYSVLGDHIQYSHITGAVQQSNRELLLRLKAVTETSRDEHVIRDAIDAELAALERQQAGEEPTQ